ncbi:hypothetical protein EU508_14325 [Pseudoalteromonas fuliginea]|uniref:Uncharacterized protein n=1 Tax=Pseudoalteromonas fuliginea TaxID=1872678 RepID=A0AB73BEQ5_9GAMM|nr:hypothetical protein EU508_14325 [Pseudoalteromonas fuliginea]
MARLYDGIERNVADAGVYQHLKHIATRRLFFPQEILEIRSNIYVPLIFKRWAITHFPTYFKLNAL